MNQLVIIYFLFTYIGIIFSFAGVLTIPIAKQYAVDTAIIGYIFSLFSIGYSLAILINGFLLERIAFKRLMIAGFLITFAAFAAATSAAALPIFAAAIFIAGLGLGVLCSNGNFFVVHFSQGESRTARLNILNFFYSFGAIVSPLAAGQLLIAGLSWRQIYLASLLLLGPLALAALKAQFGGRFDSAGAASSESGAWPISVYFVGAALFCYVVSEMVLTYWITVYLEEGIGLPVENASLALSLFWVLMAAGRLIAGMVAGKLKVTYLILGASGFSCLAFARMLTLANPWWIIGMTAVLGLAFSGLYASILSYGTLQLKQASARLMTFFVTVGSAGGIFSFIISSYLKQHYGLYSSLLLSWGAIGLVFAFTAAAIIFNNARRNRPS